MLSHGARNTQTDTGSLPLTISEGARNTAQYSSEENLKRNRNSGAGGVDMTGVSSESSARRSARVSCKGLQGRSSGAQTSRERVARGSLKVTADGQILESQITAGTGSRGLQENNQTLTGLFLSGNQASKAEDWEVEDEDGEGWNITGQSDGMLFDFFPDPPCVLPYQKDLEADTNDVDISETIPGYWKDHAEWLQFWPHLQDNRDRIRIFCNVIEALGRSATGSNLAGSKRVYVNTCGSAVAVRREATFDDVAKSSVLVQPGQAVIVEKVMEQNSVRFLKVKEGFLFETKDDMPIMSELKAVTIGRWWYRVCCTEFVEIRTSPSYSTDVGSGWVLSPHEVVVVCMRGKIDGLEFLQLADGRGWVFVMKPGVSKGNREYGNRVMDECDADFIEGEKNMDFRSMVPVTSEAVEVGTWTYVVGEKPILAIGAKTHGTYIAAGDVVKVDKRAIANGDELFGLLNAEEQEGIAPDSSTSLGVKIHDRMWVHLHDGRGWLPTMNDEGKIQCQSQSGKNVLYPSWYGGSKNMDKPEEEWMIGIA